MIPVTVNSFWLCLLSLTLQVEVPYKPSDEFRIELDYKFKPRPLANTSSLEMNETWREYDRRQSGGDPLPFLTIKMKLLKLSEEEVKIQCKDNLGKIRLARKADLEKEYLLELGYTDDMKDRVTAHEYIITFNSSEKKGVHRIVLLVELDGTFLINGTRRGKF